MKTVLWIVKKKKTNITYIFPSLEVTCLWRWDKNKWINCNTYTNISWHKMSSSSGKLVFTQHLLNLRTKNKTDSKKTQDEYKCKWIASLYTTTNTHIYSCSFSPSRWPKGTFISTFLFPRSLLQASHFKQEDITVLTAKVNKHQKCRSWIVG